MAYSADASEILGALPLAAHLREQGSIMPIQPQLTVNALRYHHDGIGPNDQRMDWCKIGGVSVNAHFLDGCDLRRGTLRLERHKGSVAAPACNSLAPVFGNATGQQEWRDHRDGTQQKSVEWSAHHWRHHYPCRVCGRAILHTINSPR
jgi:hypothetical protein